MISIISAEDRLKRPAKINMTILGPSGSGKTTLARTLPPKDTLFLDLEGGTLALQEWSGDIIDVKGQAKLLNVHPWSLAKAMACWIGGSDPADANGDYSEGAYLKYCEHLGDPKSLDKYNTVFVDSLTVVSRWALAWCKTQPAAFSDKTGKPDNRGAYGLLGQELVKWFTHLQHAPKSIIMVAILDQIKNDLGQATWEPQIEGAKAGRELPGIFDEVLTLAILNSPENKPYRALVTQLINPWGFPAKDRSGRLDMQEPPDLGALMQKIRTGQRIDTTMVTTIPASKPQENTTEKQ